MFSKAAKSQRIISIDAFRGFVIALMILVNNPGDPLNIYPQLRHAKWNGCTITDLIFPSFIFITGIVTPLSIRNRLNKGKKKWNILLHVLLRSFLLFGIGLFLNGYPIFDFKTIRILGVLQRIAIVYFLSSFIVLFTNPIFEGTIAILILLSYYLLMKYAYVPNSGKGIFTVNGNLVQYIDRMLLKKHMYTPEWDPEGLLSTMPALASALLGCVAGHWLFFSEETTEKLSPLFVFGNFFLVLGLLFNIIFPINKNLWTSSYVLFSTGIIIQCLAIFYWIIDVKNIKLWSKPFIIFGSNGIFIYTLSHLLSSFLDTYKITPSKVNKALNLKEWIFQHYFAHYGGMNASLYFAATYVLFWFIIALILYVCNIFIKL